jgi:hypothetical protein
MSQSIRELKVNYFYLYSMGLFGPSKKKIVFQDVVFGTLLYRSSKEPSKGYFSGKAVFPPTSGETKYFIQADPFGPTEGQRSFYQNLQSNFNAYAAKMKPLIENEFRNWQPDFAIKDFNKEFALVSVSIPRLDAKPVRWELAFETIHDQNHLFTIDFTDDEPQGIFIDG